MHVWRSRRVVGWCPSVSPLWLVRDGVDGLDYTPTMYGYWCVQGRGVIVVGRLGFWFPEGDDVTVCYAGGMGVGVLEPLISDVSFVEARGYLDPDFD